VAKRDKVRDNRGFSEVYNSSWIERGVRLS
jgi:hypothetical protein